MSEFKEMLDLFKVETNSEALYGVTRQLSMEQCKTIRSALLIADKVIFGERTNAKQHGYKPNESEYYAFNNGVAFTYDDILGETNE